MPSKLCKWGNSLGVRLPQFITERAALSAGDFLYINLIDGEIIIRPVKARDVPAGYAAPDGVNSGKAITPVTDPTPEKW
jgi:antitoxin MazE